MSVNFGYPPLLGEKERIQAQKRAKRRAESQFEEREHLRESVKTRWHLEEIVKILSKDWPESRLGQSELKAKMDGHYRMLHKTFPDLKSIEVSVDPALTDADAGQVVQIVTEGGRITKVVTPGQDGRGNGPVALAVMDEESAPWLQ